jgi:hypothetical protein
MEFAAVRERVSSNFGSSISLCQQLLNRNPFKQTSLVVRYPDRTEADAQRIPTFPNPLLHHLVRCGVDPSERHFEDSWPNRVGSVVDVATHSTSMDFRRLAPRLEERILSLDRLHGRRAFFVVVSHMVDASAHRIAPH